MNITATYPEVIIDENGLHGGWKQVPADGAVARLYNKDARCKGFKDVRFGLVFIGEELIFSRYDRRTNEEGIISFNNIKAGEYYLTIYAQQLYRYTEKYIEVPLGDTLKLIKDFTNASSHFKDLEPWDFVLPAD